MKTTIQINSGLRDELLMLRVKMQKATYVDVLKELIRIYEEQTQKKSESIN